MFNGGGTSGVFEHPLNENKELKEFAVSRIIHDFYDAGDHIARFVARNHEI